MLLGLGAGMGFMYWHQKGIPPFIGGRGNVKNFFQDLGKRTSVKIELKSTSSEKKAACTPQKFLEETEQLVTVWTKSNFWW